jgi:hypothetical protein
VRLVFGQAIYGEHERGHRLLGASPLFPNSNALAGRMDMQGTPPPHADWQPYVSAFAWQDHYVIARTMPDPKATRPGMVFSRAFAIAGKDVANVHDILGMLELLATLGDNRDAVGDIPYQHAEGALIQDAGLIRAVLSGAPAPLIWPGQAGFEPALAGLWKSLWPAARRMLSTRIAFSPNDVAADPPTIVTTPSALLSRWSGSKIVEPDPEGSLTDPAERYLAGIDRSELQNALVDAFGDDASDIAGIRGLVDMESSLHDGATFAESLDALRLAGHLGATMSKGEMIKRGLIDRATGALGKANAAEIRMARNLDLSAFATGSVFWDGLARWAQTGLWHERDRSVAAQLLVDAWSGKPERAWCAAVIKGVSTALSRTGAELIGRLWAILAAQPALLSPIAKALTGTKARALEAALVERLPANITSDTLDLIAAQAQTLAFTRLHAASYAAALPPLEAIRRHMAEMEATEESVRIAARKAKSADLVTAALEQTDEVTLNLAATAAAEAPGLLKRLDIAAPRWRALWSAALARNPQAALGPADPSASASAFLAGFASGTLNDLPLVVALSASPLADLVYVGARTMLWPNLPEPARSAFLEATAKGWVAAIESGDVQPAEPVLAEYLLSPMRLDAMLAQLATRPVVGCALFRALPQISEARCSRWLAEVLRRTNPVTFEDAGAIGLLTSSRNWTSVAGDIADAITSDRRQDLKPAVAYIVDLLGWYRRYLLDETGSTMPMTAKWEVLEEVTLELYGLGPSDTRLWQRAGGKDKDIPKGKTGAQVWHKVFADAKRGKAAIDIHEMIKCMYDDYPHYRPVQKLRWDAAFEQRR